MGDLPIIELENGATDGRPTHPRLFSAPGIFLLCPEIYEDCMVVALAVFDPDRIEPGRYHLAFNIDDTRQKVRFWLPQDAMNMMDNVTFDTAPVMY